MLDNITFFIFPMVGAAIALPLISVTIFKSWNLLKRVHSNVYFLGLVSCIMQIGATIVHSSGLNVVAKELKLFSEEEFVVIKDVSEAQSGLLRILSGYISDFIKDQKGFLMLGYGSMILFKFIFLLVAMIDILKNYLPISILGFKTIGIFGILYVIAHILDRVFNGLRDAPRQKLINTTTTQENKFICFAIRKSIASIGTVIGAIITFFLLEYNTLDVMWPTMLTSTHKSYILSIIIVGIAVGLLFMKIRNINTNNEHEHQQNKVDAANSSYWVYASATLVGLPILVLIKNYFMSTIELAKIAGVDTLVSNGLIGLLLVVSIVFFKFTSIYSFIPTILLSLATYMTSSSMEFNQLLILYKCFSLYYLFCNKRHFDAKSIVFVIASVASMFLPANIIMYTEFFGISSFAFSIIDNLKNNRMMERQKLINVGLLSMSGFNIFDAILCNTIVNKINAYVFACLSLIIPSLQSTIIYALCNVNNSSTMHSILSILSSLSPIAITALTPLLTMKFDNVKNEISKSAIISLTCAFLIIARTNFLFGIPTVIVVYMILKKINFDHIQSILAENPNGNKYFYSIVGLASLTSFSRINDYMFLKNFADILPYQKSIPVLFGLLYFWITIFSVLYGFLLHKGYKKTLITCVIISLLACNLLCAFGIHLSTGVIFGIPSPFIAVNLIFMLLGFFSAGDETALSTLMQDSVPSKKVYGTYFGVYDSITAMCKFLGTLIMNKIWLDCEKEMAGTGITVVGSYSSMILICGLLIGAAYVLKSDKKITSNVTTAIAD